MIVRRRRAPSEDVLSLLDHTQIHYVNEMFTRLVYEKVIKPGDHIIDVGANHGDHTQLLAFFAGNAGRVHAIEPNIAHFPRLTAIGSNVRLWPFAAGDEFCVKQLYIPTGLEGWASLHDIQGTLPDRAFTITSVVQVCVDQLLGEIDASRVTFIKLDVERREQEAICGMTELLKQSRAMLVLESPTHVIAEILRPLGYQLIEFNGQQWSQERPWLPTSKEIEGTIARAMQKRVWRRPDLCWTRIRRLT